MDTELIITNLEKLSQEHAGNSTETLAAHWLAPLMLELAKNVQDMEDDLGDVIDAQDEDFDGSPYSEELIEAIKDLLHKVGFRLFAPDERGELPGFVIEARALFIQMRSDEEGIDPPHYQQLFAAEIGLPPGQAQNATPASPVSVVPPPPVQEAGPAITPASPTQDTASHAEMNPAPPQPPADTVANAEEPKAQAADRPAEG